VNRSEAEGIRVSVSLEGFSPRRVKLAAVLTAEDKKQTNEFDHQAVVPREMDTVSLRGDACTAELEAMSFSVIVLEL
jgi:alpha-N-arabinofuranosidase